MTPEQMLERALTKISERSALVEARRAWYTGDHPCAFSNPAWDKTFKAQLQSLVENQIKRIIDKRSGPLIPEAYHAVSSDPVAQAHAAYATARVAADAEKIRRCVRTAKWSGVPVPALIDYNHLGDPTPYPLDPANAYAEIDSSGALHWLVFVWRNADGKFQATVIERTVRHWYETNAKLGWPTHGEYRLRESAPNPLGYVPAIVVDDGGSLVDQLWPMNGALNSAHQVSEVLSKANANPRTVWWGLQVLDPHTGEVTGPKPQVNPATGAADIAVPIAADENGTARRVEQLLSKSPEEWEIVKRGWRQAMWSAGEVPSSLMDMGGNHPGADTLEASAVQFQDVVREDRQVYDGPFTDLGRIYVDLRMLRLTGRPVGQRLDVVFSSAVSSTETARVNRFAILVGAGLTIRDAAIRELGASPEEADRLQANAEAADAAAVQRAGQQFLAGV